MNSEEQLQFLAIKYADIEQSVSKYVFPMFVAHSDKRFELFGTCVSVICNDKKYFCTASHVLENTGKANLPVVVGITGGFVEINLNNAMYLIDDDIDYDICLVPCDPAPDELDFFQDTDFYDNDYGIGGKQYLQGFPIAKNKSYDIHDHGNELIKTGYLKIAMKIEQDICHKFKGVSEETHLIFKYNEVNYQKAGRDFSNKLDTHPK